MINTPTTMFCVEMDKMSLYPKVSISKSRSSLNKKIVSGILRVDISRRVKYKFNVYFLCISEFVNPSPIKIAISF